MNPWRYTILVMVMIGFTANAFAYPMDGYSFTGITRLEALKLIHQGQMNGPKRVQGARLNLAQVDIRPPKKMLAQLPEKNPALTAKIKALLGDNIAHYSIAVLDLSSPLSPQYAAINENHLANPGSVGKLIVALGLFQALFDLYPNDIEKRMQILRQSQVTADEFIQYDSHKVPIWKPGQKKMIYRPIQTGDTASLITYLDWMMSASSNAAAAMVQREILLIRHFKKAYPVSEADVHLFFSNTPKKELGTLFKKSMDGPVTSNGIDIRTFRQGSFFTRTGKIKVPGSKSQASSRALIQFLLKLEQGQLVDPFSSREIKRHLYMTGRRIRYASSPALYESAVYFKSGSLYKCKPEKDFKCRKYKGNVLNLLNSVAIVEHPAGQKNLHYLVAVMSNVLYQNSAIAHQTLATQLHDLMEEENKK